MYPYHKLVSFRYYTYSYGSPRSSSGGSYGRRVSLVTLVGGSFGDSVPEGREPPHHVGNTFGPSSGGFTRGRGKKGGGCGNQDSSGGVYDPSFSMYT